MDLTANYSLGKPLGTEDYDVSVPNANMDIIDGVLKSLDNRIGPLEVRPRCRIRAASAQAYTTNVPAVVDMAGGTVDYDTDTMADLANDRITIKTAGWYMFTGKGIFAYNATGNRFTIIEKNGNGIAEHRHASTRDSNTVYKTLVTTEPILCAINDHITLKLSQTSGGSLSTAESDGYPYLAAFWYSAP